MASEKTDTTPHNRDHCYTVSLGPGLVTQEQFSKAWKYKAMAIHQMNHEVLLVRALHPFRWQVHEVDCGEGEIFN